MKYEIELFESTLNAKFIDGNPIVNFMREGYGLTWRLATPSGFLDIVDFGNTLRLNEESFLASDGILKFKLIIKADGTFTAQSNNCEITGKLKMQPVIDQKHLQLFEEMIGINLVPYQRIPDEPGKTVEELKKLGEQYFPFRDDSFLLAMAIYDWTTADFDRTTIFSEFVYTAKENRPLDIDSLTDAIWTANWPPYTPKDKYFMNSFLMEPANSREEVYNQLARIAPKLYRYAQAETRIITAALNCLPPTSVLNKPVLYSGQVDISNLGTQHFAPGFFEFPKNNNVDSPLEMDLITALTGFMKQGNTITTKKIISFTDTVQDAMHYQNGIILVAEPDAKDVVWNTAAFVTPLSDGPTKTEYTFCAGTEFLVKDISTKIIKEKEVIVITIIPAGCLSPELIASDLPIPIAYEAGKEEKASISKTDEELLLQNASEKEIEAPKNLNLNKFGVFGKNSAINIQQKDDDFVLVETDPTFNDTRKNTCTIL